MQIVIAKDPFDAETWSKAEVEQGNVRDYLCGQFDKFPDTARIYNGSVAECNDVTPESGSDGAELELLEGPLFIVLYPGDPITAIVGIIAVISIALTAYSLLAIPNVANKNQQTSSPSNTLSDRKNEARPKSRIPDICGEVLSVPDLLQVPYKKFENNIEFEYCYMCVGRGSYAINASEIYDGETVFSYITGASLAVYGPNTIPLHGTPQLQIGSSISQGVLEVTKSNAVNGQTLYAPNYKCVPPGYYTNVKFSAYNETGTFVINGVSIVPGICLKVDYDTDVKIETIFSVGDVVYIAQANAITDGTHTTNLNGSYTVINLDGGSDIITLMPGSDTLSAVTYLKNNFSGSISNNDTASYVYIDITGTYGVSIPNGVPAYDRTIGPIYLTMTAGSELKLNLLSQQGLYYLDGNTQYAWSNNFLITVQPLHADGTPLGSPYTFTRTISGSKTDKSQIGVTFESIGAGTLVSDLLVAVYIKNTTLLPYDGKNYVGNIQWRDLYMTAVTSKTSFGDVTTVQTRMPATPTALGIKERKLNMLVTRKVPVRVSGNTFGALTATKQADAIICALALDSKIGARSVSEIDVSNIYDTVAAIIAYFGVPEAAQFCYTFDDNTITFEETIQTVANSIFCQAYRQGSVTKLFFEKANSDSSILFNHRNKIPNSETRSVRFGTQDNCDGIELTYINPIDESEATFYVPTDQSAIKPQTVKTVGVRNAKQAQLLAYRAYNKLRYQNTTTEFTATQEAALVTRFNRVLVADNTRSDTQDGEVMAQNVLQLTLSQPFEYSGSLDHSIFLQLYDGTTQSIAIASRDASNHRLITLSEAPALPLCLDDDLYARTTYVIVGSNQRSSAFLVDTKEQQDTSKYQITAINYDARYYANDKDFA